MATSKVDRKRELISVESLQYIRPIPLHFKVTDVKPNCRMYALFDNVGINEFCVPITGPDAGIIGGRLIADGFGRLEGRFDIPGMSFITGSKILKLTENPNFLEPDLPGSTFGYALGTFSSSGKKETFQETVTVTNTTEQIVTERVEVIQWIRQDLPVQPPPPPDFFNQWGNDGDGGGGGSDPLAQSFFTYGIKGGCFITSIDLFVNTKDENLPLILELREMVNGYPGPTLVSPNARVSLLPSQVNVSNDATARTNFKFVNPFYLEEDKDYCFVVLANCQTYNIFTCTMGEISFETGRKVFEQPLLGSLFKSQNNMTWTAEQYEDIKFNIYQAEFNTAVEANVELYAQLPPTAILSNQLSTTTGSNVVRAALTFDHNLEVGSKVGIAADSRGTYNGIAAAALTGQFDVTAILTPRMFEFLVVPNATATGAILSGGFVSHIYVDNKGSGYDSLNPPTVTINTPPSGVTATATPIIQGGAITGFNITNPGSGYVTAPSVTISGSVGTGASASSALDIKFSMLTNRAYSIVNPAIPNLKLPGTDIRADFTYTRGNYPGGNVTPYLEDAPIPFNINDRNWLTKNAWIVSIMNEHALMSQRKSTKLNVRLSSENKNVSPVISLTDIYAQFSGYLVNYQDDEDLLSENSNGTIVEIEVIDGGAGYTVPPTVEFINPLGGNGTGATATAVLTGGSVSSVTINNPGSGYYIPPIVAFNGAAVATASAVAILTDFNSELGPNSGTARSRYITKINTLAATAESARVYVTAYSGQNSSFDVYLRTSLKAQGLVHKEQEWVLMDCAVERNLSTKEGEFLEYEFNLDGLPKYDSYDLKIVFRSRNPVDVPIIKDYRAIMTI